MIQQIDALNPPVLTEICKTVSTLYTFDILAPYTGKVCELVFFFPKEHEMGPGNFKFSGKGQISLPS